MHTFFWGALIHFEFWSDFLFRCFQFLFLALFFTLNWIWMLRMFWILFKISFGSKYFRSCSLKKDRTVFHCVLIWCTSFHQGIKDYLHRILIYSVGRFLATSQPTIVAIPVIKFVGTDCRKVTPSCQNWRSFDELF